VTTSEFPSGLVVRALERLDAAFPGATDWTVIFPPAGHLVEAVYYPSPVTTGPKAGRIVLGDLTKSEAVRLTRHDHEEGGWKVMLMAGQCSCGLRVRTAPQIIAPKAET